MKKWICTVCGYVHEGDTPPEKCPVCKAPASKFKEQKEEKSWAAEHVVGVAAGVDEEILNGLRMNFQGECTEVGMYLAMARAAHRDGYPEIGMYYEKAAYEEAEHARNSRAARRNLRIPRKEPSDESRRGNGATAGKFEIAKKARHSDLTHPRHRS